MHKVHWSEKIQKPPRRFTIEPFLRPQDNPIDSHPRARSPRIVPLVVLDYGSVMARIRQVRYIGRTIFMALREVFRATKSIQDNPYAGQRIMEPDELQALEAYARKLGVSDIGYTKLNTRYIFKGFRVLFPNAIVFTMEMDRDKIKQAPAIASFIEIFRTYYQLCLIANQIADYMRQRGYNAEAEPALAGEINFIPVAIDAGLGVAGKNGLLVTKSNGPRVRLAAVLTDIENLPYSTENPHGWVRDYCQTCNNCIQHCPADAIYIQTKTAPDGGPIFIDHTLCADPFSNDNGCTLCIKYCPFSFGEYDQLKSKFLRNSSESV
jgi:NAD-dependent dihydropyrimidine dehydrogenase PreA subunit